MRDTWVQSLGWEDPLEKEMATHSSTVAWKIPWMEEPGRLQLDTMWYICPTAEQHSTAQMHQIFFKHPLVERHLGCFQFVAFTNKTAMKIHI